MSDFKFPLLWTVGFSGKRQLPGLEGRVRTAIDQALQFLRERAQEQHAELTAISSIARGGDVIFAECCLNAGMALPWKCLLPFEREMFFKLDLEEEDEAERSKRRTAANACLAKGVVADPLIPGKEVLSDAARVTAYLECGYRTVDESDVMILVLREHEFHEVITQYAARLAGVQAREVSGVTEVNASPILSLKAGTRAAALYATAGKHPCILLNADALDPWVSRKVLNDPKEWDVEWFADPNITEVMREAVGEAWASEDHKNPCCAEGGADSESLTEAEAKRVPCERRRQSVWMLMKRLGCYADHCQKMTRRGLVAILTLHLVATALAAIGATMMDFPHDEYPEIARSSLLLAVVILGMAFLKPVLAGGAFFIEHCLHGAHSREKWLYARILAELCRGSWAMWPLPRQPMDAADEEDFPKVKRLLRTLRLMRELDATAEVRGVERRIDPKLKDYENETQEEANMRVACGNYIDHRLQDQADYYERKLHGSKRTLKRWQLLFEVALIGTVVLGVIFACHKLQIMYWPKPHHEEGFDLFSVIEFALIIGPFLASYALGMITIIDCRRRARRYNEMQHFLNRLAATLRDCAANPSRLRLIEHAERMMIEEQHEWFSTTRNFSV